jgi:hypothetical protein
MPYPALFFARAKPMPLAPPVITARLPEAKAGALLDMLNEVGGRAARDAKALVVLYAMKDLNLASKLTVFEYLGESMKV